MLVKYLRALFSCFVSKTDLSSDADVKSKIGHIASYGQQSPIKVLNTTSANGWTVFGRYTLPSDGVLFIRGKSTASGGYVNLTCGEVNTLCFSPAKVGVSVAVPFRFWKGASIRLAGDEVSDVEAFFYPSNDTI